MGPYHTRLDLFETFIRESSIILQKQLAEEALRNNEEQFRKIVDYSPFPISIVESSGIITYLNKRFTDVFGYTIEELPTIRDWQNHAYPDKKVRDEMEATRLSWLHSSAIGEVTQIRARIKSKEGTNREIEIRAVSMSGARQFITYEDITDRLEVEKIRAIHKSIVETSEEAIIGKSPDGTIISWNNGAEKLYGYPAREIIGKSVSLLIPTENRDNFFGSLTGYGRESESIIMKPSGRKKTAHLSILNLHSRPYAMMKAVSSGCQVFQGILHAGRWMRGNFSLRDMQLNHRSTVLLSQEWMV